MKKALTIAGSDSGAGAGIQADLKTFAALGVYGSSVITVLTAQNTVGVQEIFEVDPAFVENQIDSVMSDIGAHAAKTGMLYNRGIIKSVAGKIKEHGIKNLVVDPVMVSATGASLLKKQDVKTLIQHLLPLAHVVTPNTAEAEVLGGMKIETVDDMKRAAKAIASLGPKNVVVTGGHLPEQAVDVFYSGRRFTIMEGPRIETRNTHGTGCSYSSAIAAGLAKGMNVLQAVREAKEYVTEGLRDSIEIGKGPGPLNHLSALLKDAGRYYVLQELEEAISMLKGSGAGMLIPEVQSNLGLALDGATRVEDVAAFPGRIIRVGEDVQTMRSPAFGASQHVASIILVAMQYDPSKRAVMNIRFEGPIVDACRAAGLKIACFDRRKEPEEIKMLEGSSLEWGTEQAIQKEGSVPDIIYDLGDVGKEPMIRVIGNNAKDVVEKVLNIRQELKPPQA
jgi:hydroxymethylpyrimidine/phosphomethylpyrimidine kinase